MFLSGCYLKLHVCKCSNSLFTYNALSINKIVEKWPFPNQYPLRFTSTLILNQNSLNRNLRDMAKSIGNVKQNRSKLELGDLRNFLNEKRRKVKQTILQNLRHIENKPELNGKVRAAFGGTTDNAVTTNSKKKESRIFSLDTTVKNNYNNGKQKSDFSINQWTLKIMKKSILQPSFNGNLQTLRQLTTKSDLNNIEITQPNKEPETIHVESPTELSHVKRRFTNSKCTLHNYFSVLAEELKDPSLKVEPLYKASSSRKDKLVWTCLYHLKWPRNVKITAQEFSKKQASILAANKALDVLMQAGKITDEGLPIVYDKEEIKQLKLQKQSVVTLDKETIKHMENIVELFDEEMRPITESVNLEKDSTDHSDDLIYEDSITFPNNLKFLGAHKYFAKEKVQLPISTLKEAFIKLLLENKCVIVKGEPGCGKSTRVPQYVMESWIRHEFDDDFCRIAVTQPRRIAAISLSKRVSSERNEESGHIVGYRVRLKSNFHPRNGRILYCTTGILLRHLQTDPKLSSFSHVILDEAHERDVNTDLLMNLLKAALKENDKLKVVVMSATIDTEAFAKYFDDAPIFNVPGFTYPITRHFLPPGKEAFSKTLKMCQQDNPQVIHEDVVQIVTHIHKSKPEGAILVFLPGWEDLTKVQKQLQLGNDSVVYLVHSKLKDSEQNRIFSRPPPGVRKIILSTNIAETSITIDDVVYVVDTGIHKDNLFDVDKGISVIDNAWISKASANQRSGRAGRCQPGESYHLYTKERYEMMSDYTAPKILNTSLTKVVLDSKVFSNNMDACQFMNSLITPPEPHAVQKAVDELKQLELLDEQEKLTPLGRTLVNFQLEPCLAKAMVNGVVYKCATPIVDIITLFSSDTGIFGSTSLTNKDDVKKVKAQYSQSSDHLALMRVFEKWLELFEEREPSQATAFCERAKLVPYKLEFVNKLRDLHFDYLHKSLKQCVEISDSFSDNDELVKAVLYSGTGTVLEHRNWDLVNNRLKHNVNILVTRNNHKATIASESVNFKRRNFPSNFLVYINETRSNVRRTTIVRECSLIPALSVLLFNNRKLELLEKEADNGNLVIIGIKDTKLQLLCDKDQAQVLIKCKEAMDASYRYLIYLLTGGMDKHPKFHKNWDLTLRNLDAILQKNQIR